MPAIDHLVFVSPDLGAGVEHVASLTGVRAAAGGAHPGRGTHNALAAFDDETYLEIIGIDPNQPDPEGPRPFGLTAASPMRLATFAVHPTGTETISEVAAMLRDGGFDPGPVGPMSRTRPDGVELHWHLTHAEVPVGAGVVPFVIDWGQTPNPAASLPALGGLARLRIIHPSTGVCALVAALDPRIAAARGEVRLEAEITTASGTVSLT